MKFMTATLCFALLFSACTTPGTAKKAEDVPREHFHHVGRLGDF